MVTPSQRRPSHAKERSRSPRLRFPRDGELGRPGRGHPGPPAARRAAGRARCPGVALGGRASRHKPARQVTSDRRRGPQILTETVRVALWRRRGPNRVSRAAAGLRGKPHPPPPVARSSRSPSSSRRCSTTAPLICSSVRVGLELQRGPEFGKVHVILRSIVAGARERAFRQRDQRRIVGQRRAHDAGHVARLLVEGERRADEAVFLRLDHGGGACGPLDLGPHRAGLGVDALDPTRRGRRLAVVLGTARPGARNRRAARRRAPWLASATAAASRLFQASRPSWARVSSRPAGRSMIREGAVPGGSCDAAAKALSSCPAIRAPPS